MILGRQTKPWSHGVRALLVLLLLLSVVRGWGVNSVLPAFLQPLASSLVVRPSSAATLEAPPSAAVETTIPVSIDTELGSAALAGTDPDRPQKVNQDAHFLFQGVLSEGGDGAQGQTKFTVLGALDGHGSKGEQVTAFLQKRLPQRLAQYLHLQVLDTEEDEMPIKDDAEFTRLFHKQKQDLIELGNADPAELVWSGAPNSPKDKIEQALTDSFLAAHLDARRDESVPTGRSGTTCVVCVLVESKNNNSNNTTGLTLYTAAVGDSSATLTTCTHWQGLHTKTIATASTVHNLPEERERVERSKGRIDGSGNVFLGPVGIAMTRALGDTVLLQAGVLPAPMVARHELPTEPGTDYYICAGTDGVFDVLSHSRVADIVTRTVALSEDAEDNNDDNNQSKLAVSGSGNLMDAAAQEICSLARDAWLGDLPIETKVDDITCALARCSIREDK